MAALTDTTKGLKRISEGMTYGEVVTMFPITRAVFDRSGIVEKENFFYVPVSERARGSNLHNSITLQ